MIKRYLITGGLGFIGRAITISLLKKNNFVIIADNNFRNKKFKKLNHKNLIIHNIDIRQKNKIKKICRNVDSVIHLAFINGTNFFYEQPRLVLDVALKGIINILEICEENSIPEFFLASSSEVYQNAPYFPTDEKVPLSIPNSINPRYSYAAGKILSEIMLMNSDHFKRAIIFRPHNIYGPNMGYNHVIPEIILKTLISKKQVKIEGTGLHTRSFCFIDDFVEAFNILLKKGKNKNIYNIGTQNEIKIKDLVKKIINFSEKKMIIKGSKEKSGNPSRRCPNISKIKRLGFKPRIKLNHGLKETYEWYLEDLKNEL
jgi:nucleoside-diphosphate-sugar epimerase|tara:strand:- start:32 stop:976 length:945 start_codon:yes stop_codon:yes gene_type:complete